MTTPELRLASYRAAVALGALRAALMTLERGEVDRAIRSLDDAMVEVQRAREALGVTRLLP